MAEPALKIVEETQQGRWRRVCDRLRAELGEEVYTSWFQSLELMEVTAGRARLSVPTRFLRSWITEHFGRHLVQALATEFPGVVDAAVELRSSARAALAPAKSFAASTPKSGGAPRAAGSPGPRETPRPTFAHRPADGAAALGSPLDRRMTF
ncbi:MAG: hypothetical protein KGQ28_04420 [Hyphomicrobiales bacterium]|nr:hypothetical protein [Hyphomicrobiales bacterium]